jgi:small subunit ribosomal protein S9
MIQPLLVTERLNTFDLDIEAFGGGPSGQAGAIRLAIARALIHMDPELYPPLKLGNYLTRDAREVERKKPGKRKARRAFQWVKR